VVTFSIVTVCRNDADALVPTIRNVVGQRFTDFQYVIQDGGSSDVTPSVVAGFGDWVDVFVSEPDTGIYQAMNRAVRLCTGRYTLFINAADMLFSLTTLAELAEQLEEGDDIVTGQSLAVETGKPHPFRPPEMFWAGMTFDHQAAVIRTDLLKQHPYDESLHISGDFDFFSRLRKEGANFRSIAQTICRKPYAVGASASFVARFRERFGIAMRNFGDVYPVEQTLKGELIQYMIKQCGVPHLKAKLETMSVPDILVLHDALQEAKSGRRRLA